MTMDAQIRLAQSNGTARGGIIKCRLCQCKLGSESSDDFGAGVCGSCGGRPEAWRLGGPPPTTDAFSSARDFTDAEKALIRKLHSFMPALQLLSLLNERLHSDLGPDAIAYSLDQLQTQIGNDLEIAGNGRRDWPSLRALLAQARRDGVLQKVSPELIHGFAVVYSLNAKQELSLIDILLEEDKQ